MPLFARDEGCQLRNDCALETTFCTPLHRVRNAQTYLASDTTSCRITRHAGKLKINKYQKPATPNIEDAIELHRLDPVAALILLLIETTCQYAVLMACFTGLPMHGPHRELTVPSRASRKTQFTVQMTESNTLDNACCAPKFRRMMSW